MKNLLPKISLVPFLAITAVIGLFSVFAGSAIALFAPAFAPGHGPAIVAAEATPQPYDTTANLPLGTVVQINDKNTKQVIPASYTKLENVFGVVVNPDNLPITISNSDGKQQYVATTGKYKVLVTNENGVIKAGDQLAVSSVTGTAMKASTKEKVVLGKALNNFDGKNNVAGQTVLKYDNGKTAKTVSLGLVLVAINIQHNPDVKSTKTKLPPVLERIGVQIAEKEVSPFRLYLSVGITFICIIVAIVILYAGIRNSLVAIGRNPLSKKSIFKGLFQIILTAFIVLILGLFTVYLLLKL